MTESAQLGLLIILGLRAFQDTELSTSNPGQELVKASETITKKVGLRSLSE